MTAAPWPKASGPGSGRRARAICFLASAESGPMTGATLDFDQSILGGGDAAKPDLRPTWGEES